MRGRCAKEEPDCSVAAAVAAAVATALLVVRVLRRRGAVAVLRRVRVRAEARLRRAVLAAVRALRRRSAVLRATVLRGSILRRALAVLLRRSTVLLRRAVAVLRLAWVSVIAAGTREAVASAVAGRTCAARGSALPRARSPCHLDQLTEALLLATSVALVASS